MLIRFTKCETGKDVYLSSDHIVEINATGAYTAISMTDRTLCVVREPLGEVVSAVNTARANSRYHPYRAF